MSRWSVSGGSLCGVNAPSTYGWRRTDTVLDRLPDIRVGEKVSLMPFWNGFAMSNSNVDASVGQLSIGVTIH